MKFHTNTSRILSTVLASTVSLSLFSATAMATDFHDVSDSHWGHSYVTDASSLGLVGGYEDGSFKPDQSVTVGEFLVMLVNSYPELKAYAAEEGADSDYDHWASEYAYATKQAKLLSGYMQVSPTFLSGPINREQVAFFLYKATTELGGDRNWSNTFPTDNIKDYSEISSYYRKAVTEVYLFGIMSGKDEDSQGFSIFDPKASLTRAEATVVLLNLNYKDRREPASTAPLSDFSNAEYNENGNQIIREGEAYERPMAKEGDIVVKADGTEVVLVKDPESGVVGWGQPVAADLGLVGPYGGTVADGGGVYWPDGRDSLGNSITNQTYYINQLTGEGHWRYEIIDNDFRKPTALAPIGTLSEDLNWISMGEYWSTCFGTEITWEKVEELKAMG